MDEEDLLAQTQFNNRGDGTLDSVSDGSTYSAQNIFSFLTNASNTAGAVIGAVKGSNTKTPQPGNVRQTATPFNTGAGGLSTQTMLIIGAIVGLVVLLFAIRK